MGKLPPFHTYEEFLEFCLHNRKIGLSILNKTRKFTPFVFCDMGKVEIDPNTKITMCAGYKVIKDLTDLLRPRLTGNYRKWRISVLSRDGFQCIKCGARDHLHVHHIKKLSEYPSLSMDVDNGITLCSECHRKEHAHKENANGKSS